MNAVDPITVEVMRNYLYSTAGEMRHTLMRAAYNPIIYEIKDFALGLYDLQIRLIAQDMRIPLFVDSLGPCLENFVKNYGEESLDPGDVLTCDSGPKTGRGFPLPEGNVEKGKIPFVDLECNSCHRVAGVELPPPGEPPAAVVALGAMSAKSEPTGSWVQSSSILPTVWPESYPRELLGPGEKSPVVNFNDEMTVNQMIDLVAFLQSRYEILLPQEEMLRAIQD